MFEIHMANIETFINHTGFPEFYLTISALANPDRLEPDEYKRWLWEQIRPNQGGRRRGAEYNFLGFMARANKRSEIILLTHEDDPKWVNVVIAAIRWYQNEYLGAMRA